MKMFFSWKERLSIMVDMTRVDRSTKTVKQRKEASEIIRKYLEQIEVPGIHYPDPVGKGGMT